ncbi:MAG: hypothetical protein V2I43_16260 [Parvularcula sp.]|jgi:hypothetical protein|nr:hypothetical protein [Parvularcula sp.]
MTRFELTPDELRDVRQLLDLGTEEAVADLWSRYQLSHCEAWALVDSALPSPLQPTEGPANTRRPTRQQRSRKPKQQDHLAMTA